MSALVDASPARLLLMPHMRIFIVLWKALLVLSSIPPIHGPEDMWVAQDR